jgi:hypothetical protein
MKSYSAITGMTSITQHVQTIALLGTMAIVISAATTAYGQFRAIPDYIGVGAGLQFRNDINKSPFRCRADYTSYSQSSLRTIAD